MDWIEALVAIALAVAGLITTSWLVVRYLLGRVQQADIDRNKRIDELEKTVKKQQEEINELRIEAAKVPDLETQVGTITRSLKEQQQRYDEARTELGNARRENERLTVENANLAQQIHDMAIQVTTYKDALLAVGRQLTADIKAGTDKPETKEASEGSESSSGEDKPNGTQ